MMKIRGASAPWEGRREGVGEDEGALLIAKPV